MIVLFIQSGRVPTGENESHLPESSQYSDDFIGGGGVLSSSPWSTSSGVNLGVWVGKRSEVIFGWVLLLFSTHKKTLNSPRKDTGYT